MRANASPTGWALLLIVGGLLLSFTSVTAAFVTREPVWHYLIPGGCFVQLLGWAVHRGRSGGAV
ncbi:hypothetical protein ACFW2I_36700 [Streptomyces nigra]|uniref:hypothetical protein n=1 Tax=Streptomyces nigra TaxID=1827580 RepID=UPI0036A99C6B